MSLAFRFLPYVRSIRGQLLCFLILLHTSSLTSHAKTQEQSVNYKKYEEWKKEEIADMKFTEYIPRLKFQISPPSCKSTPDNVTHDLSAEIFTLECPADVTKVKLSYIRPEEDRTATAVYQNGIRITRTAITLPEGSVETRYIQSCIYRKNSCKRIRFDVRRGSTSPPDLALMTFSHEPVRNKPFGTKADGENYHVTLFSNEPTVVTAKAKKGFFVDSLSPRSESGLTDSAVEFSFTPRAPPGEQDQLSLWISNSDRSIIRKVDVDVDCIQGHDTTLKGIRIFPGRLDPQFSRHQYSYFLRIPSLGQMVTMDLESTSPKTRCYVKDAQGIIGLGHGTGPLVDYNLENTDIVIDCVSTLDSKYRTRYVLQVVRQTGGDTLLSYIAVLGGTMDRPFSPEDKGPYHVRLDTSDNPDEGWVSFFVKSDNRKSIAFVEGRRVDTKSNQSPFFKINIGDAKRFHVNVITESNPVAETYLLDVSRESGSLLSYLKARRFGMLTGWMSVILSSTKVYRFLHNTKMLQWASLSNRLKGNPETYDAFSSSFHQWNLIFPKSKGVYFKTSANNTFVAPPEDYAEAISRFSEPHVRTNMFNSAVEKLRGRLPDLVVEKDGSWVDVDTYTPLASKSLEQMIRDGWNRQMAKLHDTKRNSVPLGSNGNNLSPDRALSELTEKNMKQMLFEFDVSLKRNQAILDYASSIFFTTALILGLAIAYLAVWLAWLRRSHDAWFHLRQDFPKALHPARFWTALFDFAFISFAMASSGLAFLKEPDYEIVVYHLFTITPSRIFIFAITSLVLYPVVFVAIITFVLAMIKRDLVFSKSCQRYHDQAAYHAKATHVFCNWVPILRDLLTIEIRSIMPISRAVEDSDSMKSEGEGIVFREETRMQPKWTNSGPKAAALYSVVDMEEGKEKPLCTSVDSTLTDNRYTALVRGSNASCLKYKNGLLRVSWDEKIWIDHQYDNRNARVIDQYPEALVGYVKYSCKNSYGHNVKLKTELQARHLKNFREVREFVNVFLPREHVQGMHTDAWHNLFGKAQKTNIFYVAMDRISLLMMILFLNGWTDHHGWRQSVILMVISLALCACLFPPTVASACSKWFKSMETMAYDQRRMNRLEAERDEQLSMWPFRALQVKQKFKNIRQWKTNHRWYGGYGAYVIFVKRPLMKLVNHRIFQAPLWFTIKEFYMGPMHMEVMKALTLLSLTLANVNVQALPGSIGSFLGMFFVILSVVVLNIPSIREFYDALGQTLYEVYYISRRFAWMSLDAIRDLPSTVDKVLWYSRQSWRRIMGARKINWGYPGLSRQWIRDQECFEAVVVNNESGLHMPAKVYFNDRTRRSMDDADVLESRRYGLHKTLIKTGCIGCFRQEVDRSLPIQMTYKGFFRGKADVSRLVATLQIVNHNGQRYPIQRHHSSEDDSYLSLYANPKFVPEPGLIRCRHKGHGYFVRFDKKSRQLIIKGPGLKADTEYRITSKTNAPAPPEGYSEPEEESSRSSSHHGGWSEAEVFCRSSGDICVPVREGCAPDLQEDILVYPPYSTEHFVVDPTRVKVDWDRYNRQFWIFSSKAIFMNDPYKVRWKVATKGTSFQKSARANSGVLLVDMEDTIPNLSNYLTITAENGASTDIDPKDTDAHCFQLPDPSLVGCGKVWSAASGPVSRFYKFVKGRSRDEAVDFPIPCTVVQCVNPLDKLYRLEPNFAEGVKAINAHIQMFLAQKADLDIPERMSLAALHVMSSEEFISFWKKNGITIQTQGRWINPMIEPNNALFRGKGAKVRETEQKLRAELDKRFTQQISALTRRAEILRSWATAYNDTNLYGLQLERDLCDWENRPDREQTALDIIEKLKEAKAPYRQATPGFKYPMIVNAHLITKKPDMAAQLAAWDHEVRRWLESEENASTAPNAGGQSCLKHTKREFMTALRKNLYRPENLLQGRYKTILHFVTPSVAVRGTDPVWRPDPLAAHSAIVRWWSFDENGNADFNRPAWLPCALKLTGNCIKMMLPNPGDVYREFGDPHHWKNVTGWEIPLTCFEKVQLIEDHSIPTGDHQGTCEGLGWKLVFRKQLAIPVDDNYVKRIEDGVFDNNPRFSMNDNVELMYRIMLGKTITQKDVHKYPGDEVSSYGDRFTVFPLTFRIAESAKRKWETVVFGCYMNENHRNLDGFNGVLQPIEAESESEGIKPSVPSDHSIGTSQISDSDTPSSTSLESSEFSFSSGICVSTKVPDEIQREKEPQKAFKEEEEEFLIRDKGISDVSRKSKSEEHEKQEPPKPKAEEYRGQWKNWRYHGKGVLYDANGEVVYDGEWKHGKRWGKGTCNFVDRQCCKWQYVGCFVNDEFCGQGKLTLRDTHELDRLRRSNEQKNRGRMTEFEGIFKIPTTITRKLSDGDCAEPPTIHQALLKRFFAEQGAHKILSSSSRGKDFSETSSNSSSSSKAEDMRNNNDEKRTLVIDMRRMQSYAGDIEMGGLPLKDIGHNFNREAAVIESTGAGKNLSISSTSSISGVVSSNVNTILEDLLPHRSKWIRHLDPTLGYQNLESRLMTGTVTFADGAKYRGPLHEGLPHGKGYYVCAPKDCSIVYYGNWKSGKPHSYGIMQTYVNGEKLCYFGEFYEGLRHGRGTCVARDGKIYMAGSFFKDKIGGGDVFVDIAEDLKNEWTVYPYRSYLGAIENGLFHGRGKVLWWDDVTYRGEYANGQREGVGTITDDIGNNVLNGKWDNDVPHGHVAKFTLPDGKMFTGNIVKGQRQGIGEIYHPGGDIAYEGYFINDMPHGRGTAYSNHGNYDGEWRNGKYHGYGRYTFRDIPADIFSHRFLEGNWANGVPHGACKYLDEKGIERVYQFNEGLISKSSLAKYSSGRACVKEATVGIAPEVPESEIRSHDPLYWGRKRYLDPNVQTELHSIGSSMWENHMKHGYVFCHPDEAPVMPDPPTKILPERILMMPKIKPLAESLADSKKVGLEINMDAAKSTDSGRKRQQQLEILVFSTSAFPKTEAAQQQYDSADETFVEIKMGNQKKSTKIVNGDFPLYNHMIKFNYSQERIIVFDVLTRGMLTYDSLLGSGELHLVDFIKGRTQSIKQEVPVYTYSKQGKKNAGLIRVHIRRTGDDIESLATGDSTYALSDYSGVLKNASIGSSEEASSSQPTDRSKSTDSANSSK